jgi:hypothetical protein
LAKGVRTLATDPTARQNTTGWPRGRRALEHGRRLADGADGVRTLARCCWSPWPRAISRRAVVDRPISSVTSPTSEFDDGRPARGHSAHSSPSTMGTCRIVADPRSPSGILTGQRCSSSSAHAVKRGGTPITGLDPSQPCVTEPPVHLERLVGGLIGWRDAVEGVGPNTGHSDWKRPRQKRTVGQS